jgi:DNA-binding Lrp family transcriptional regulator
MAKRPDKPEPREVAKRTAVQLRRLNELQRAAQRISDLEARVGVARAHLDARLFYWHEDGIPIAELARSTGLSRQAVYNAIDRYRAQLGA